MLKLGSFGTPVTDLQKHLQILGYPIDADGEFGPETEKAVKTYQALNHLDPDGIVGPLTVAALNGETPAPPAPSPYNPPAPAQGNVEDLWWVKVARKEIGVHEIAGSKDNPRIVFYHGFTTLKATDDETPWCSSFLCFVFGGGTKSAAARSWATWGQHLDRFIPGCIMVYSRTGGNHVNIGLEQAKDGSVRGLGGNQGNRVSDDTWHSKSVILAYRWPPGVPIPA